MNRCTLNACLGNFFEHYDTALFSFLIPILSPILFPKEDPVTALIYGYALIPLGMFMRPIGSLVFGFIGDAYGRERALFLTLVGMGVVSVLIAFTPTYMDVGILAPLLFFFGRLLQNFFAGGEAAGGAVFLLENASVKKKGFFSGVYGSSTVGGALLASFGVLAIGEIDSGWRYLYLFGGITAFFGSLLRRGIKEEGKRGFLIKRVLWENKTLLFCIAVSAGFSYASFSVSLVLLNGALPFITQESKSFLLKMNSYLLIFDFLALPFFGWVGDKISKERLMLIASMSVVVIALPISHFLKGSLFQVVCVRILFVTLGVAFSAPFHAWARDFVPKQYRYTLISFGYAVGSQVIGAPTSAFSMWLYKQTKDVSSLCLYWMFLGALASGMLLWNRLKTAKKISSNC